MNAPITHSGGGVLLPSATARATGRPRQPGVLAFRGGPKYLCRATLAEFAKDLATVLDGLPTERTIVCDIASVPGVEPYQAVLAKLADERGFRRAQFRERFARAELFDVFALDRHHVNSRGYGVWFDGGVTLVADDILNSVSF